MSERLQKIIKEGKTDPSVAMVIFAVELENMQSQLTVAVAELKAQREESTSKDDFNKLEKRVTRLEGFILKVLVGAASFLVLGVVTATVVFRP